MPRIPAIDVNKNSVHKRERFKKFFGNRERVFLPVIHSRDEEEAMRRLEVVRKVGADGAFLVNHGIGHQKLLRIARTAVMRYPDLFLGVKCLDLRPQDVFCRLPQGVRGVWVDNAGANARSSEAATAIRTARQESGWEGLYFGGVAFDFQSSKEELELALSAALRHVDVIAITPAGTDEPPNVEEARRICSAIGVHPLAMVFRAKSENIVPLLPHVDCYFVTTGISRTSHVLNQKRALAFAERAMRSLQAIGELD